MDIKNIETLIAPYVKNGSKFIRYERERLLAAGENYGSVMLAVKLIFVNEKKEEEFVRCVAKLVPPSQLIWDMFNTPVTFQKEIDVYQMVIPILNDFGREHGIKTLIPFIPEYIGSRISLDPSSGVVDKDAVLLLKNLKFDGYSVADRFEGFDYDTSVYLLKNLATFHASGIAYKLANPEEFKKKFGHFYKKSVVFKFNEESIQDYTKILLDGVSRNPKYAHLSKRMIEAYVQQVEVMGVLENQRELFSTLIHNDFWVNNVMLKYENGKPISSKFVDFQMVEYNNPAFDVLFFLYVSMNLELLPKINDFLKVYHNYFIAVLEKLNCDTLQFGFEQFENELEHAATTFEFCHILFMLQPIFAEKGSVAELENMKDEGDMLSSNLHKNFYPRLQFIVQDFADRGWI